METVGAVYPTTEYIHIYASFLCLSPTTTNQTRIEWTSHRETLMRMKWTTWMWMIAWTDQKSHRSDLTMTRSRATPFGASLDLDQLYKSCFGIFISH